MPKRLLTLLLLCLLCAPFAAAASPCAESYCFSSADFLPESRSDALRGIFLTAVPAAQDCRILCGTRQLRAGDTLTAAQLSALRITPCAEVDTVAALSYLPLYDDAAGAPNTLYLSLKGVRDQPPTAAASEAETYKNLALRGTLSCSDPEGGALSVTLVKAPKRGSVAFGTDGSFVYTPGKNKVGKDSFTYTVTDDAGNTSEEACVTIHILVPRLKETFADMQGDPNEFEARFLRESGVFSGEKIGGTLCFCPEKPVNQEEFLMMLMHLTGLPAQEAASDTSDWFTPWQRGALRAGIVLPVEDSGAIRKADAAILVADVLSLEDEAAVRVFSDPYASAAAVSMTALENAGLPCLAGTGSETMTRRDAAVLLYAVSRYCGTQAVVFPWA